MAPYHETLLAFYALEEVDRIDRLVGEYDAVLASVRPRMEADALNRDFGRVIERLRFDPDAVQPQQWRAEDVMAAAQEIMKSIKWKKSVPPLS